MLECVESLDVSRPVALLVVSMKAICIHNNQAGYPIGLNSILNIL